MADLDFFSRRAEAIRAVLETHRSRSKRELRSKKWEALFVLSAKHDCATQGSTSCPGEIGEQITDSTEKAFQRAIFDQRTTEADLPDGRKRFEWLDIELPVVPGTRGRRLACDLIAGIDGGPTTICEVKYSRPGKTACAASEAEYAICELLVHLQLVALNAPTLTRRTTAAFREFSWQDVASANVACVIANCSWWKRFNDYPDKDIRQRRILHLLGEIFTAVGIRVYLFETHDGSFGQSIEQYKPAFEVPISLRRVRWSDT